MTEDQIKHMVDRFLTWELPENFSPDGGITFKPIANEGTGYEVRLKPCGTNILNATEARSLVTHMLDGLPNGNADDDPALTTESVNHLIDQLVSAELGLAALGIEAGLLKRTATKLIELEIENERFKSDRLYVIGHNDGWDAAFASGLPGEEQKQCPNCGCEERTSAGYLTCECPSPHPPVPEES